MFRWCSLSSVRENQSEAGESVKSVNQIALNRLVKKKCNALEIFLHQFNNSMPPNVSGILYQRSEKDVEELAQSRYVSTRNELTEINSSCFPPSILNGSIMPNQHVFKQPAIPPVQGFQPISNQDNRERSMVLDSFAKINEENQASIRSLTTDSKITQKADSSVLKSLSFIKNKENVIRKKGFLTKKATQQAPVTVHNRLVENSVLIGRSEKENLIQEDESSDESEASEHPPKRKIQTKKIRKNKPDIHNMPTPSKSQSPPPRKMPRIQVVEKNENDASSTSNIEKNSDFDFIFKKWTLVLIDKTLRIQGDKYDKNGSALIKSCLTSGPIKALIKKNNKDFIKTEKYVYLLDGVLCDRDNAIPDNIKSFCLNGKFPKFWRKVLAAWIKIESETEEVPALQAGSKDEKKISKPQKAPKEQKNAENPKLVGKNKVVKKANSKNKVKKHKKTETNKKEVLELMMTNDSILCTSMTPNGLLNSIKKTNNPLIYTPPSKLLNDLRGSETELSNYTDSDDNTKKINKPNPVVGRVAKVVAKPKKQQPKPKLKPKIQIETSYQEKSFNFSDLSSIEEESD